MLAKPKTVIIKKTGFLFDYKLECRIIKKEETIFP